MSLATYQNLFIIQPFETPENEESVIENKSIKFILLGKEAVGKTSFINQLSNNKIPELHDPTIMDQYYFEVKGQGYNEIIKITDSAGQEDYREIIRQMIGQNEGFIIIYSVDDLDSFKQIENYIWKSIESVKQNQKFYAILIGNKKDKQNERRVSYEQGKQLADKHKIPFHEISLKNEHSCSKQIFNQLLLSIKKGCYQIPQINNTSQQQSLNNSELQCSRSKSHSNTQIDLSHFKQSSGSKDQKIKEDKCICNIF